MSLPELSKLFHGTVFVSACEPSADLYAALFIQQIKKEQPGLRFIGIGGPEMAGVAVKLTTDFRKMMSLGFAASAANAAGNLTMYRCLAREMHRVKPDIFMAVAYPGVNLLLCRYARRLGIKTVYLLPPQIWAWGNFRKYFIKKWVDLVISFFPFEHEYYRRLGIPCRMVNNPLIDHLKPFIRTDMRKTIGFMPGSRASEIKRNIPVIMMIMDRLKADYNDCRYVIILHEKNDLPDAMNSIVHPDLHQRYQAMKNCDFLITCSGTASLEAALMNIPQVFFNRPSLIDYHLTRRMIRIKEYNLANLFFGQKIVPAIIDRKINRVQKLLIDEIKKIL